MFGKALLVLGALALCVSMQAGVFTSTFEVDAEGWGAYNLTTGLTYPVTQVSPGGVGDSGYLSTEDTANGYHLFQAPGSWTGNFFGGSLDFSLRFLNPDNPDQYAVKPAGDPLIRVLGGGGELWYVDTADGAPGDDWTAFSILLGGDTSKWRKRVGNVSSVPSTDDLNAILSDVTGLYIMADWANGHLGRTSPCPSGPCQADMTGLDSVTLTYRDTVIPEPGTVALVGCGIAALVFFRRRRQA